LSPAYCTLIKLFWSPQVQLDMPSVEGCAAIVDAALAKYNAELCVLTSGAVESAAQVQRRREWLATRRVVVDSLDEDHVAAALARPLLPPDARRVLELGAQFVAVGSDAGLLARAADALIARFRR
jgi:hypothetical protein